MPQRSCWNGTGCSVIQRHNHNARRRTVMIIKSVARLALAVGCLTAIVTLPTADAQMGAPGGYGYGPAPGPHGAPPGSYGQPSGSYAPQGQYVPPAPPGTQLITNGPQTNPGDVSSSWSAQRNVAESEQYERLLKGNPAFRQLRMRKECGPITDPQLRRQCLDSFARY